MYCGVQIPEFHSLINGIKHPTLLLSFNCLSLNFVEMCWGSHHTSNGMSQDWQCTFLSPVSPDWGGCTGVCVRACVSVHVCTSIGPLTLRYRQNESSKRINSEFCRDSLKVWLRSFVTLNWTHLFIFFSLLTWWERVELNLFPTEFLIHLHWKLAGMTDCRIFTGNNYQNISLICI